jgi:3-methyladenine DNA glycosylase AlkC
MDNENAFKNWINTAVVKKTAAVFASVAPGFQQRRFLQCASKLAELELKGRVLLITAGLRSELTGHFTQDAKVLKKVLMKKKLSGFELWPISEYISQHGTEHVTESLELMYQLTQQFTAEFAIRPFLQQDPNPILEQLERWLQDDSVHVRRWISEGTRPLLPWGGKIQSFVESPATLHLLEALKYDEELYVRKSVANHLNDISKHHPELLVELLKRWEKEAPRAHQEKILWIKKHALRTLIKKGHRGALGLMGAPAKLAVKISKLKLGKQRYRVGDTLEFHFCLESTSPRAQKVIVDYGISFLRANGSLSTRVFKLKTIDLKPSEKLVLQKKHSLKRITTNTFYPGVHELIVQVNGEKLKKLTWYFDTQGS